MSWLLKGARVGTSSGVPSSYNLAICHLRAYCICMVQWASRNPQAPIPGHLSASLSHMKLASQDIITFPGERSWATETADGCLIASATPRHPAARPCNPPPSWPVLEHYKYFLADQNSKVMLGNDEVLVVDSPHGVRFLGVPHPIHLISVATANADIPYM